MAMAPHMAPTVARMPPDPRSGLACCVLLAACRYGSNEWRDDLKKVLKKAGLDGKDTVFLFTDTQIVQEAFLEDINNILNSGEVGRAAACCCADRPATCCRRCRRMNSKGRVICAARAS